MDTSGSSVDFSVKFLTDTDCAIDKTSQFRITRYSQAETAKLGNSLIANAVKSSTKLGDYYYSVAVQNDVCSQDESVQSQADGSREVLTKTVPSTLQFE